MRAPLFIGGVAIASIVPVGWWIRNIELIGTTVLILRLVGRFGDATGRSGRRLWTLASCLVLAVTIKAVALLTFKHVVSQGMASVRGFGYPSFVAISLSAQVAQHVCAIALAALAAKLLG
jgi:hypothetical protein